MIRIPAALFDDIRRAAERVYPEEGCGLLVGRVFGCSEDDAEAQVCAVAESRNIAPPPRRTCFEVDPALRLRLMRELRGSADTVIGHWHSHPDAAAVPSARDAAMVYEPDLLWLIVGVFGGRAGEATAWRFDTAGRRFRRAPLAILG